MKAAYRNTRLYPVLLSLLVTACSDSDDDDANDGIADTVVSPTIGEVVFSDTPESSTYLPYATFAFSAQNASGYECQVDNGSTTSCESPFTVLSLQPGEHTVSVRGIDGSGAQSDLAQYTWTVASIYSPNDADEVHDELISTTVQPAPVAPNSWRGIFRVNCDFSHSSYDDPIVYPGQDEVAHLHRFYGNTLVDESTDTTSLFTTGESTCQGNTLNRSSYWVPALLAPAYDPVTAERLMDDEGEPAWQVVPAVVGGNEDAHEIFYYSAGIDDLSAIQTIPTGLKMIAGSHMGMPGNDQDTGIVRWHCQSWESSDTSSPQWSTSIPECVAPDRVRMDIFFPSCWNGTDVDSSDHKSHMAYPVASSGNTMVCPSTHPVAILRVSYHYAFGVRPENIDPTSSSSRGWRLASDMYDVSVQTPGGMSLHADWFNGWHPEALQSVLDNCVKQELDCHDGNLANGYRLSGTRQGTQTEPPIVNKGLGY